MTTPMQSTIKMSSPRDVIAAVPHLLGFWPSESLVVIGFHLTDRATRFAMTLRSDLPQGKDHHSLGAYLINGPLRNQRINALMLVVVGEGDDHAELESTPFAGGDTVPRQSLPYRELVDGLTESFTEAGIDMLHAAWAPRIRSGGGWWCYEDETCTGEIPDPQDSTVAAAMAASGSVTFDSREDVEALVAPEADELIARRAAKLDALQEDLEQQRSGAAAAQEDLRTVFAAIERTHEGTALTEDDHARVLLALSDNRVRDLALGTALGERASAAEQLWLILVRKAPAPELADVAALLAFSAYLRGEGALAGAALQRIEATRPDHRLGNLLRQALDAGIPAAELAVIARDAADDARMLIDEDSEW